MIRGGYGQSADPTPFIEFRNSFPVTNAWEMPQINNNPFIPVTTLRQGLINTNTPPDLNAGLIPLPSNSGTSTFPRTPMRDRIHSFNVFIERELPGHFTGQVGYVGTRAKGQMGFININAGPPGTGQNGRPLFIKFGLTANINSIQPYGDTTYDALQAQLQRRFGSSLLGLAYTWSKTINFFDNNLAGPFIQFLPEKQRNKGLAGYDRPHNLQTYWVYDLPFGKSQRWANSGWASKLLGGFQVNGVMSIMSGRPFSITQGSAPNLQAAGSGQFPNLVKPSVAVFSDNRKGTPPAGANAADYQYFDRSAFAPETGARFGNVGRNILRGPGFFEVDLSLYRTFFITENVQFQFRAEALNVTNHANFANPDGNINSTNFGFITATTGPNQSRQWRFGARVSF